MARPTTLRRSVRGTTGEIVLDRPDKLNPLSVTCLSELIETAAWFDARPDVRAVLIRGEGRAFTAGADLAGFDPDGDESARDNAEVGRRMADAIEGMHAVTVAAIHGWCIGGGVVLASACDIRIAARSARFSIPEIDLGIPLTWGALPRLVREIGPTATRDLVLSCRRFEAGEALRLGLVSRVVDDDTVLDEARTLVAELGEKSTYVLRSTLASIDACAEELCGTGRSWSDSDAFATALHDPDSRAMAQRYLDRVRGR